MKTNYFLFSAAFAFSFLLIACSSSEQSERFSKQKEEPPVVTEKIAQDTVMKQVEPVSTEKPVQKETEKKEQAPQIELIKEQFYAVQLGAFKEIKNVEKFEKMVKKDFPDIFIKTETDESTKTYKVTIGKFEAKNDAYKLRDYCVEKGYKDAWVITIPK